MLSKKELLSTPNYLLTKYQNEIYRQLISFMDSNNLTQKEVAQKLGVSGSYISQVLNGNFNFTLKKLIELGLMIGKVPYFEFVGLEDFWIKDRGTSAESLTVSFNVTLQMPTIIKGAENLLTRPNSILTQKLSSSDQQISLSNLVCCAN